MGKTLMWMLIAVSSALSGCATLPPERQPLKLDEMQSLGKHKQPTDALIEQIEQRGLDFQMTPENTSQLKSAGVKEPVIRYLQGRAAGERAAYNAAVYRDSFRDPFCMYNGLLYPFQIRYVLIRQ